MGQGLIAALLGVTSWSLIFQSSDAVMVTKAPSASFRDECTKWHNHYRAEHKVSSLKWSDALAARALSWAQYLATANKPVRGSWGENIYLASSAVEPCTAAVKAFYSENTKYNYGKPGFTPETARFSQLVWKNTKLFGAAKADRADGKVVVVVRYESVGNFKTADAFRTNVLRPIVRATNKSARPDHSGKLYSIMATLVILWVTIR